jgi:hypothetical protein
MDTNIILDRVEYALYTYLKNKGSHSSSILRCYYIDKEDGQQNCIHDVMSLIRRALDGTKLTDEESNTNGRNNH